MKKLFSLVLAVTVFSSLYSTDQTYEISDLANTKILSPTFADRKIAKLKLDNSLSVYIISDKNVDQSSAALSVMVGSWQDPQEYPGMAHFLEHMLFMGSAAYPGENAFMNFIWEHSGNPNAYTAPDRTVYGFSITNDVFLEGLDRFSHFFIDPLLPPSGIERELHAVDQEYAKNIENDSWRKYMIEKETGNPNHPNRGFSTGNSKTLSGIPQSELKKWFEEQYSANLMNLFIYSPLPLEQLKEAVIEKFSKIPNKNSKRLDLNIALTSENQRGHITFIRPVKDIQNLTLAWELPKSYCKDTSKCAELLAYSINQGSSKSLLETLKRENLAENLVASVEKIGSQAIFFQIDIDLTNQGLKEYQLVIQRCFEGLARYKSSSIPTFLFDEKKKMSLLNYQYQKRTDAFDFAMQGANMLGDEDLATYPEQTLIPSSFNPTLVNNLLKSLTAETCIYTLMTNPEKINVQLDRKEHWLEGEYAIRSLPEKQLASWNTPASNKSISLPPRSSLIPTNLMVSSNVTKSSELEKIENEKGILYFSKDSEYLTPESALLLHIQSPKLNGTSTSNVLIDLYLKHSQEALAPLLIEGQNAGLYTQFSFDRFRLNLAVFGYSEKSGFFLEKVLKNMKEQTPSKIQFNDHKVALIKSYQNEKKDLPVFQAYNQLNTLLVKDHSSNDEKIKALEQITYEEFLSFHHSLYQQSYLEGLFYGNLSSAEATAIWENIHPILDSKPFENHYQRKVLHLLDNEGPFLIQNETKSKGNAAILMLDFGDFSFEKRAVHQILSQALKADFFATLRTKQKTGYFVKSWDVDLERQLQQYFAVQSNSHQPIDLIYRFGLFIDDFAQDLKDSLDQERFDRIKKGLVTKLQTPPKNLFEKGLLLQKLAFEHHDFSWIEKRIEGLESLTYEKFLSLGSSLLSRQNKKRIAILYLGELTSENDFRFKQINPAQIADFGFYEITKKPMIVNAKED